VLLLLSPRCQGPNPPYASRASSGGDNAHRVNAGDEQIAAIVDERIAQMDRDGDGGIDGDELYSAMIDVSKAAVHADKKNRNYRHIIYGLIGFSVLLTGAVFGTSIAAAYLAKDTQVNNNRALLTMDGQPVGINTNEVDIPLGAIAFMPTKYLGNMDQVTLKDLDGAYHNRAKQAISIVPEKSLTLWTTSGDKVTWDINDQDDGKYVNIELQDGTKWRMPAACAACTATSVVSNESVMNSLDDFHESIDTPQESRRILRERFLANCEKNPNHSSCQPTPVVCEPQPMEEGGGRF
jgi:hypothetical protein